MSRPSHRHGFTLIELSVVLAISLIVGAVVSAVEKLRLLLDALMTTARDMRDMEDFALAEFGKERQSLEIVFSEPETKQTIFRLNSKLAATAKTEGKFEQLVSRTSRKLPRPRYVSLDGLESLRKPHMQSDRRSLDGISRARRAAGAGSCTNA